MIFESIEFYQYRCFMEGSLKFYEKNGDNRSINLIVAENGGGKTELLFAFSWVLYDFDFSTLQNKEDTPYSLNSEIYRNLEKNIEECCDDCWVKVVFSHEGKTYTLKKKEYFEKVNGYSSLKRRVESELFIKKENGETDPPIMDQKYIEKILNDAIPLKVLNGIIFDGERMQKLSSSDERSVEGVKGVIFDVTNQEKLEYFLEIIKEVEKKINTKLKSVTRKTGGRKLEILSNQIESLENEIEHKEHRFEEANNELEACEVELDRISFELKKHSETKEFENKRVESQKNLKKIEKQLQKEVEAFGSEFNTYGFVLASSNILDDCQEMIDTFDVPRGLNTQAVESILKGDKCICGVELSPERIETLNKLLGFLPPGNLNSALLEQINGLKSISKKAKSNLKKHRLEIKNLDSDLISCKEDIAYYRSQISQSELTDSQKLEEKRDNFLSKKAELDLITRNLPEEIEADKITVNYAREQKASLVEMDEIGEKLAEKWLCRNPYFDKKYNLDIPVKVMH
ncbi:DNA sulfur modification protein DndD [Methanolobus bombayensis]|nr:DNA sulfur modification protein DndD [Methanolobus bombayensis]